MTDSPFAITFLLGQWTGILVAWAVSAGLDGLGVWAILGMLLGGPAAIGLLHLLQKAVA